MSQISGIEVGQKVKLSPKFLKTFWRRGNTYFPKEIEGHICTITKIEHMYSDRYFIMFEGMNKVFHIDMQSDGTFAVSIPDYNRISIFLPVEEQIKESVNPGIYCNCGGNAKENWAGGERFFVCVSCKKEKEP